MTNVVVARDLKRHYTLPRESLFAPPGKVYALDGVSFSIDQGRSLGVVGESGCGKSTLARCIMALEPLTAGSVEILDNRVSALEGTALRRLRRHFQMVFQDPYGSLDPRHTVGRIVAEPLVALEPGRSREERRQRVTEALESVALKASDTGKYPHEFSGGQRQRIAIARALITRPEVIIADEPVSALDVSVQAQVLNLLQDLQDRFGVTYLLISHDLAVVESVCHDVAVMYLGKIVEQGPTSEIFANPKHPYTRALIDAVPQLHPDKSRVRLEGTVQSPTMQFTGCPFAERCPEIEDGCQTEAPELREVAAEHQVSCHRV